jgi:hypothetical protein
MCANISKKHSAANSGIPQPTHSCGGCPNENACGNKYCSIFEAIELGHVSTIEEMYRKEKHQKCRERRIREGLSGLHLAAIKGHTDVAEKLLDLGEDVNACDTLGNTAFIHAISWLKNDVAQQLLERGVDINVQNKTGQCALHYLALHGWAETNQIIFDWSAKTGRLKPNLYDNALRFPINCAVEMHNYEIAEKLVEFGAKVGYLTLAKELQGTWATNPEDFAWNHSPLRILIKRRDVEVIDRLVTKTSMGDEFNAMEARAWVNFARCEHRQSGDSLPKALEVIFHRIIRDFSLDEASDDILADLRQNDTVEVGMPISTTSLS